MKNKILISLVVILLLSFLTQKNTITEVINDINMPPHGTLFQSGDETPHKSTDENSGDTSNDLPPVNPEQTKEDEFVKPHSTQKSNINNFNMKYQLKLESGENNFYSPINLKSVENYSNVKGITTFRGNNYRDTASFRKC